MQLETFTKALADQTRLRIVMLLLGRGEFCVCDLTAALDLSQPKISRHLAVLREAGLLLDRKAGLWVHYQLHPGLPAWVTQVLSGLQTGAAAEALHQEDGQRLVSLTPRTACP